MKNISNKSDSINNGYIIKKLSVPYGMNSKKENAYELISYPYFSKIYKQIDSNITSADKINIEYIEHQVIIFLKTIGYNVNKFSFSDNYYNFLNFDTDKALHSLWYNLGCLLNSSEIGELPVISNGELIIDVDNYKNISFSYIYNIYLCDSKVNFIDKMSRLTLIDLFNEQIEIRGGIEHLNYLKQNFPRFMNKLLAYKYSSFNKLFDDEIIIESLYEFLYLYKKYFGEPQNPIFNFLYQLVLYIAYNPKKGSFNLFLKENDIPFSERNKNSVIDYFQVMIKSAGEKYLN